VTTGRPRFSTWRCTLANVQRRRLGFRLGKGRDLLRLNSPKGEAALGGIPTYERHVEKVRRNQTCPCGSGRKFKRCRGWRHIRWAVTERLRGFDKST
jgi:SEC-C motif-containing protein